MGDRLVKNISPALIVSIIALAALIFCTKLVLGGFLSERESYASLRTQIADIQYKRSQLTLAQTSAQNVDVEVLRIENAFINESDVLNILLPLERAAANAGITGYKVTSAQDIVPTTTVRTSSPLQGTTLRIEGNGTLQNLFSLLQTLQALPYFSRIESFTIQQNSGASLSGLTPLQAIIIVKFYSQPNP